MLDDTGCDHKLISQERLMARVDYYLHCELDEEHDRNRPEVARKQLIAALREELLRASRLTRCGTG